MEINLTHPTGSDELNTQLEGAKAFCATLTELQCSKKTQEGGNFCLKSAFLTFLIIVMCDKQIEVDDCAVLNAHF